jgi:hypothetical protein
MTKREADRWAKSYAAGLLMNFQDSDDVLFLPDGTVRPLEDIDRIQDALRRLSKRLSRTASRQEIFRYENPR